MSDRADDPGLPVEPEVGEEQEAEPGFAYYEFDRKRKESLKERLGITFKLSQVQYRNANGELITEPYLDYARCTVLAKYPTFDGFVAAWFTVPHKHSLVVELFHVGVYLDKLQEEINYDLDGFDLLCVLAYDRKGLTRRERVERVRSQPAFFEKYGARARRVLDAVLAKFLENGYHTLDNVLDDGGRFNYFMSTPPLKKLGGTAKLMRAFGGRDAFHEAMRTVQQIMFQDVLGSEPERG